MGARKYLSLGTEEKKAFTTFQNVSGMLECGESCLTLGPKGSGKTSLLQVISGRIKASKGVLINRNKSSFVSAKDGEHCTYLTVCETFEFAAEYTGDYVTNRVTYMMDMLDLSGVKDTVIGDENLKGISGGQKKRVTIGEIVIDSNTGEMNYFGPVNQIQNMHPTSSYASIEELVLTNNTRQRQLPIHQYLCPPQYYQRLQHIHPPPSNKNKSVDPLHLFFMDYLLDLFIVNYIQIPWE